MKCANKTMTSHEGGVAPAAFFFCPLPFGSKKKTTKKKSSGTRQRKAGDDGREEKKRCFFLPRSFLFLKVKKKW